MERRPRGAGHDDGAGDAQTPKKRKRNRPLRTQQVGAPTNLETGSPWSPRPLETGTAVTSFRSAEKEKQQGFEAHKRAFDPPI